MAIELDIQKNFKGFSLDVKLKGQAGTIGILGASGSGKSTMLKLCARFYDPRKGSVRFNGMDMKELEPESLMKHCSMVFQDVYLFQDTLKNNIRFGRTDATDEEIIEALKIACAWEFVEKLPDTINSALGERGRGLSEGQAQRISIARAVLRNAPILLLDEATSALDVTTERKGLRNIIEQKPNKTCIVTTHRPSVLNMCQRVYRVMETKVTELDEEESSRMAIDF